jgi:glucose-1-phosphate adenylyltransferase
MGADYYQTLEDMQVDLAGGTPWIGIGEGTTIRRAIIDKNARIGRNARLLNEAGVENADGPNGSYYIRDRIIIVPKNGSIPDGTVV